MGTPKRYVLSIDQSTSGTKAILVDETGRLVGRRDVAHEQFYPRPGWVEHDAVEIYKNTITAVRDLIRTTAVDKAAIVAAAIANQRETAVVWEKRTGQPIGNAVVWQCRRGETICDHLRTQGKGDLVRDKTGLVLSPYFSAAKIRWLLDETAGAREKAERGELLGGTIDSWLIWKLSGGAAHVTDFSNASRTQLFNITTLRWDEELLELFAIPPSMMAEVRFSDEIVAYSDFEGVFDAPLPIAGVMGDSHAALFGQNCFRPGMAKATYGTGSSIMMNVGDEPIRSKSGLVTSIAWGRNKAVEYVLEGNINCAGATIQWLVDSLGLIDSAKAAGKLAASVPDNQGVYLVPAFVGLGAPYWDEEARASITGLSRGSTKAHLVRAAEESIAYQIRDILDLMVEDSGMALRELRVDGGPTKDEFLMRFQADLLNIPILRSGIEELSALGAAYMAGLAIGLWSDQESIAELRQETTIFKAIMPRETADRLYQGWKQAINRTISSPVRH